jgi:hypothetical protein
MMFCSNCAERLPEQAVYCPSCGVGIESEDHVVHVVPTVREEQDPFDSMTVARTLTLSQRTKKLILLGMAIVAIVILVVKFGGIDRSQPTPEKTVKNFIDATMNQDAQQLVSYLYFAPGDLPKGQDKSSVVKSYEEMFAQRLLDIESYEVLESTTDDDKAVVNFKMQVVRGEDKNTSEQSFHLIKLEGKWFIVL